MPHSALPAAMNSEYLICRHPDRGALAEIFKKEEAEAVFKMVEGYEVLYTASSRQEALDVLSAALENLPRYTPNDIRAAIEAVASQGEKK